jgi:SAM-dependent methyltransferase
MSLVEIVTVERARPDARLWGHSIDLPRPGSRSEGWGLSVAGWVLGQEAPAVAVEVVHEGGVMLWAPIGLNRPDVAAAYPAVRGAEQSGFRAVVRLPARNREWALLLRAVLQDQQRVPLGAVRVRRVGEYRDGIARLIRSLGLRLLPGAVRRRLRTGSEPQGSPQPGLVRFGDLRRLTPISRVYGFDRGRPVDRFYVEAFLERWAGDIHGRVLEIGEDVYTRQFGEGRVLTSDVLDISEDNLRATIVADLARADHVPSDAFDCIILTQTLHLIYDIRAATRTLHRILRPGGVLLVTVPGISQFVGGESGGCWYWAFSTLSAEQFFDEVFPPGSVAIEAHGNVLAATALLQGLAAEELRREELEYRDPEYQVLITVRAVKAP